MVQFRTSKYSVPIKYIGEEVEIQLTTAFIHIYYNGELIQKLQSAYEKGTLERVLKRYANYELLIIDEIGYLPIAKQEASLLFQLIRLRHEVHSTILTTNIPFSKWGDVFQDSAVTAAILDRLIHHSRVFQITGNSYRMKDYKLGREQRSKKKTPDDSH